VWNANDPPPFIPRPTRPAEQFRNCIVAPVVLMKNFDGIIIAADRLHGEFSQKDIEALLSVGDQATVAVENIRLQRELQHAYLATVSMLADAVEAKDPYTHGHCEMVSRYARLLADELGLSEFERAVVCYAALLHDVGKIGVSDGVLNKPGPLLPEERELVRSHVRVGHDLLRTIPALESVADAVLHHHEWWDGSGYPDGLRGESIPMPARIVAVVDAFGAMVTRRSYKEAYSEEHARDELRRAAGTQFDPHVVEAFVKILDTPEALDRDPDFDAECGVLPGFAHPRNLVRGVTS
jgi:putative nucleotidyltransferase with HDIG domain